MKKAFELNKALLNAVTACDYEEAERLLVAGADPLGSSDENEPDEHLLGELFCEMRDNENLEAAFPKFLELFYAHGMDIASRNIPTDDGDNIHPLWMLAFCQTESGLKILHTMLEYGLDRDSAEVLADHILLDIGDVRRLRNRGYMVDGELFLRIEDADADCLLSNYSERKHLSSKLRCT